MLRAVATLYDVLRLLPSASDRQIQSAYRILASEYHPDVNHEPGAARLFTEIQRAHETLGDPQRRLAYDALLASEAEANLEAVDSSAGVEWARAARARHGEPTGHAAPPFGGPASFFTLTAADLPRHFENVEY